MDAIRFYWLVFRAASRRSMDLAQAIVFVVLAGIGALSFSLHSLGLEANTSDIVALLGEPRFYAILFGAVILTRLLCAPYWVWRDERNRASEAIAQRSGMSMREIIALNEHAAAIREQANEMRMDRARDRSIDESYADLRTADCPEIIELFHNYDAKLTGLLSSGALKTWARKNGDSRLMPLDAEIWKTHRLRFHPKSPGAVPFGLNQTFLRTVRGDNSSRYDICLNVSQVKWFWPELSNLIPNDMRL
jgi:hypothetical protein